MTPRKNLFWILILSATLSLPSLWVPYYKVDELTNALFARFLNNGTMSLKDFLGSTYFFTHYLYALIFHFTPTNTLIPVHAVYAAWKLMTVLAFFWAGQQFKDKETGLWAALFYTISSVSFMSKDFHTPAAEAWAVLPAVLAAGFVAKGLKKSSSLDFLIAGFCVAMATLFKAPMGITCVAVGILIFMDLRLRWQMGFTFIFGFVFGFFTQALFYSPFSEGIFLAFTHFYQNPQTYIGFHTEDTFVYWGSKFFIRSLLVGACSIGMNLFVCHGFRNLFLLRPIDKKKWEQIFFLCLWFLLLAYVVTLGKRIFFYYYLFMLPPACLLAALSLRHFDEKLCVDLNDEKNFIFKFLKFTRKHMAVFLAIPALGFSIEGALNYSTKKVMPSDFHEITEYVEKHTKPDDHIYVWGYVPQIYFYSGRLPATTNFWSDTLAGSSPGSPAMEYLNATGYNLSLREKIVKDMGSNPFTPSQNPTEQIVDPLAKVSESELFTIDEILNRIEQPNWKKVFGDLLKNPPELIIDTSPTNYRGFGSYPISKYELLKRFVVDNYVEETVVEKMIVYRLKN